MRPVPPPHTGAATGTLTFSELCLNLVRFPTMRALVEGVTTVASKE